MPSGFSASLDDDICPQVAVVYYETGGTQAVLGVSRGGWTFQPSVEYRNVPFDGKRSNIELLDRIVNSDAKMTGTLITLNNTTLSTFIEPGSTLATAGTPATVTITPAAASLFFGTGSYLTNLDMEFDRGDGKTVRIRFPKAFCTEYEISSTDPGEAELRATFEARLANATAVTTTDTRPYVLQVIS